jgi:flagellar M-ring protein FliF
MTQSNQNAHNAPNTPNTPNTPNITNKYLMSMKAIWHAPVVKQLVFVIGIAAGSALGFILFNSIQEPIYRPLDYQVNQQNMSAIVDTLDKAGVKYKVSDHDGVVYVASNDMQLARLKLASAGVPKDDSFNFSYLNDQSSIGGSQFLENARYIRALESDLAKTINAIEGVSGARVHIAIPQNNVFADENKKPTASVVVNMGAGIASDKEKIRAIVQIIASSVPGLDSKDVAITDQYGHYLSGALDQDSIYNSEALNYQNNIQNYYEKRIESMIAPLIGDNKVNVRVHANIDFTQQEEAQEKYDPTQQVIRSEQDVKEQISSSGASGPPGALSNSPPDGGAAPGSTAAPGGSDGKTESIKNYEIGKSVSYKKTNQPKIVSLSVAVVVDNDSIMDAKTNKMAAKPLTQDKINKITELVKATIGYDEKRGDKVTVINSSFNMNQANLVTAALPIWDMPWFWDVVKKLIGILLGFTLLWAIYKRMIAYLKTTSHVVTEKPTSTYLGIDDKSLNNELNAEIHEMKQEKINRLKEMAATDPDRVAIILKNWVGKN